MAGAGSSSLAMHFCNSSHVWHRQDKALAGLAGHVGGVVVVGGEGVEAWLQNCAIGMCLCYSAERAAAPSGVVAGAGSMREK